MLAPELLTIHTPMSRIGRVESLVHLEHPLIEVVQEKAVDVGVLPNNSYSVVGTMNEYYEFLRKLAVTLESLMQLGTRGSIP